jgi:hypothetical protein
MLFAWGADGITGREALVDLLDGSATTMSWRIAVGPVGQRTGLYCWLNLHALAVGPEKRGMLLDRCTKCRPVPTGSTALVTTGSLAQGAQAAVLASVKRIHLEPNPADSYSRPYLKDGLETKGFQTVDDPRQADAILVHARLSVGVERLEGPGGVTYAPVELWAFELRAADGRSLWAKDFRTPLLGTAGRDLLRAQLGTALREDVDSAVKGGRPNQ